ncbi:HdeD family acid-resistance protein [Streptomyces sp. NPDC090741]|uniref:HdeD family acid-resistance protein n=1 Tax=Streptomyces sp. NPDC090741 TaxID=3365967 RepID=UPI0037F8F6F4
MGADRSGAGAGASAEAEGKGKDKDRKQLKRRFGLLAVLGLLLVVAGLVGLFYAAFATLTTVFLFGWLLLAGGLVGLVQAFQSRKSNHFWLAVVVAAINIAAGFVILRRPEASAEALTMFAALFFLIGGLFRLVGGLVVRGTNLWVNLVQGAFGILLGFLVLANWPGNSLYVIGTFFSLALLFDGLSLVLLGMSARRILGLVREDEVPAGEAAAAGPERAAEKGPTEDQERSHN